MNWGLIGWFFGVIATLYGIKFVFVLFRTLFSKESMEHAVYKVGDTAQKKGDQMTQYLAEKIEKQKEKRRRQLEEEKPTVIIR